MDLTTYFLLTLKLAKKAALKGEVPVGAAVVKNGVVIGTGFNQVELKGSQLYHAEVIAIRAACRKVKNWRLNGCNLFVTLEPCLMCAGLIEISRIDKVYFLISEPRFGFATAHQLKVTFEYDQFKTDLGYRNILKDFFKTIRLQKQINKAL